MLQEVQEHLSCSTASLAPLQSLKGQLQQQQEHCHRQLAQLEQERQQAQLCQEELDRDYRAWRERRAAWWGSRHSLEQSQASWQAQQRSLQLYQEQLQRILQQLHSQESLQQKAYRLLQEYDFIVDGSSNGGGEAAISVEELAALVSQMRQDYEQRAAQVSQQRAELEQHRKTLQELQARLATASPEERLELEMDIDYAQSACSALEEALLPQEKTCSGNTRS